MSLEQEPHPYKLNAPSACAAPPPLFDSPANEIGLPIAPGPWSALTAHTESGANRIVNQVGETVGWATDKYGYVTGFTLPALLCPREQIALHARLMAEAPAMAKILAALATLELFITARLMTGGHGPDIALIQLAAEAKVTLARVYPEGRAA